MIHLRKRTKNIWRYLYDRKDFENIICWNSKFFGNLILFLDMWHSIFLFLRVKLIWLIFRKKNYEWGFFNKNSRFIDQHVFLPSKWPLVRWHSKYVTTLNALNTATCLWTKLTADVITQFTYGNSNGNPFVASLSLYPTDPRSESVCKWNSLTIGRLGKLSNCQVFEGNSAYPSIHTIKYRP